MRYLEQGSTGEILFSGGTYQIEVADLDTQEHEWVFVQFDQQNRFKDSFCSCSEEGKPCVHQAAALLRIFGDSSMPLHCRFARSLWHCICSQLSFQMGFSPKIFQKSTGANYVCVDAAGNEVLRLKGVTKKGAAQLHKILCERLRETEETSIKFSNLSEKELSLWRAGTPSHALSYELSFWGDLAKWWMLMQEQGLPYEIAFKESKKIPHSIQVSFQDLSIEYRFSKDSLLEMIPALSTVESPLKVHEFSRWSREKIEYDKEQGSFHFLPSSQKPFQEPFQEPFNEPFNELPDSNAPSAISDSIDLGEWTYIPRDGFYSQKKQLLSAAELEDPEKALNAHLPLLKKMLVGAAIYETPTPVSYTVFFDTMWTLHIRAYLFHPEDFKKDARLFTSWVYLPDKGFYRIEKPYFEALETQILASDLPEFINQRRAWLNAQEGFHTHISPVRSDFYYVLNDNHSLQFSRNVATRPFARTREFGQWVYLEGDGFFLKNEMLTQIPANVAIPYGNVAEFIKKNRSELQLIKGFFTDKCPLSGSGLSLLLTRHQSITIAPDYQILPEFFEKQLVFFGEYLFIEGEGFCELPSALRLPERYWNTVTIKGEEALSTFFLTELPSIQHLIKDLDQRLHAPRSHQIIATNMQRAEHGYAIQLDYKTEFGQVPLGTLWRALRKRQRFLFSEAGMIDLKSPQFQWFDYVKKTGMNPKTNVLTLSALELLRMNAYELIQFDAAAKNEGEKLWKELTELQMPEMPDITGLQSDLRTYQKLGVRWLWFLYQYGLSGLLCDDMGLGKTHQAMALLIAIINARTADSKKPRFLIICPTSVIYHWQEKLHAYLPKVSVWTFHGAKRRLNEEALQADILLTSYGIWRNEQERLHALEFEVAIFDELQIAKNQFSSVHRSLLAAQAKMRLGLTGTPIENRLRELKALFDIVLPSYMPAEHRFREQFIKPIEKEANRERQEMLSRLAKPFTLRRKKEDVLTDLPEKIEEISHCELLGEQKRLYYKVLTQSRERILEELQDEEAPIPFLHIFALFSHLKQICNHPAAYLKKPEEYMHYHSGKWELFKELLDEARASQQKVVVFSQYLLMLDIIQMHLQKHEIQFAGIRSSTVNRGEQLKRFNSDPNCEVFLGSLQAAGLGIDLTAASVVIHYDRWWNAARENQATDRVHRIGQKRGVQVFKLMTKETIEEHIHLMIHRKGRLMEELIGVDDHEMIKTFNRQEISKLLNRLSGDS